MPGSKKLKLGWLFPYSGVFKNLKEDLKQGLESALKKEGASIAVETYPEFIQTGGLKDTEDALKKLLLFERVDLVIGVTSTKVALGLQPLLAAQKTPAILLNLGADIPSRELSSDYLLYNSMHLWKSQWVIGKWSQQRYGGEPSINMSIYECGYGLHDAFRTGTAASGAQNIKMNLTKNFTSVPDTTPLLEYIRVQQSDHAHVLLSGKEGEQFLHLFHDSGLEHKPVLTVNPYMVEDGMEADIPSGMELYNASTWSLHLGTPGNRSFTEQYMNSCGTPPNAFSLLAYEAGLALSAAIQSISGSLTREELSRWLMKVRPRGPRGEINLSTRILQTDLPVYIRKTSTHFQTGKTINSILHAEKGIEWDDPSLDAQQSYLTGWQNPYLCV